MKGREEAAVRRSLTEDRLADEEARHEVEEGTPARAVGIRGINQRLGDGGDAVAEHGALRAVDSDRSVLYR